MIIGELDAVLRLDPGELLVGQPWPDLTRPGQRQAPSGFPPEPDRICMQHAIHFGLRRRGSVPACAS
ncbi:hypothetical protein ACIBI9_18750 [Nonomuraea sp. NPDC050451]|uniref:hypothetical protein n=1 Tax=Nonomuraea sp. NPDC050451 TaxID=3364364 RepID=UPI0037983DE0